MYVQPPQEEQGSVQIPRDYSGNAFFSPQAPPPEPHPDTSEEVAGAVSEPPQEKEQQGTEESVQAGAFLHRDASHREPRREARQEASHGERGGLLGRFPLLSSLLPPSRGKGGKEKHGGHGDLVEWAIIGLAVLLFLEDSTDDILPLLLLLLLWD